MLIPTYGVWNGWDRWLDLAWCVAIGMMVLIVVWVQRW
jgi:hypothetical protein